MTWAQKKKLILFFKLLLFFLLKPIKYNLKKMDDSLYDEFGNYLGPDLEDEDEDLEMQEVEESTFEEPAFEEPEEEESREEGSALMQIDGKSENV
jgi:hypothetical protein